jgi:DNA-directed RNA polymerase subunit M/transcription elongation factor TFIIS
MASPYIVKKLTGLLGNEDLVEMYLRKYGELVNEQYIEQIQKDADAYKVKAAQQAAGVSAAFAKQIGEDPIYETLLQCPACYREDVVVYQLRSKSQAIKETLFLVPQYSGIAKYFAVDFNLLQTGVCPECLFASPDPRDWTQVNKFNGKITQSQLSIHTKFMADVRDQEFARKNRFSGAKGNMSYFSRPRTPERAIESLQLSMMRAELEGKHMIPAMNFKLGSYTLKIADIEKKLKKSNIESLKKAEQYFSTAALKSECNSLTLEMMCIYQVFALNMFLKNKERAAEFFKITKNTLLEKEMVVKHNPSPEARAALIEVSKWEKRITSLWEYRDDADYWKNIDKD